PTRMGAMVSDTPDTTVPEAPEIKTAATPLAKPAAKRQASAKSSAKTLTPPAPEPPVLSVVASRTEKKSRLPVSKRKLFVIDIKLAATPYARPAPTRPESANSSAKTRQPPAPEPLVLSVVASRPEKKSRLPVSKRKLFVLDTNVLLHDSNSLFKFEEHDIFLPMMVLEELDHQKKGMSEVARNARQVSRSLDGLVSSSTALEKGIQLDTMGNPEALGCLHLQTTALHSKLPIELPVGKADNAIL